jgi:dolichol-phosphate mannosyltransferase
MDKEVLYVVLPCYNEEENICSLVREWNYHREGLKRYNIELEIVIVNDGSSDNTHGLSLGLQNSYDNVTLVNHEVNKGLGETLNTGINYVLSKERKGMLCLMDGDMTHDPLYVFSMIDKMQEEDLHCVIASRYRKGSRVEGLSFYRKFLSYAARAVYTTKLKITGVRDYTCGYRLYKLQTLKELNSSYNRRIVSETGFACMMELLVKLSKASFKVGEVPFILKYQLKGGQSKMRVWKTVSRSLMTLMRF